MFRTLILKYKTKTFITNSSIVFEKTITSQCPNAQIPHILVMGINGTNSQTSNLAHYISFKNMPHL